LDIGVVLISFFYYYGKLRSHLKKWILVQGQGGRYIRTGGILQYFEDLNLAPNAEIGTKDFRGIAS
jgi:hypothetical protein